MVCEFTPELTILSIYIKMFSLGKSNSSEYFITFFFQITIGICNILCPGDWLFTAVEFFQQCQAGTYSTK